MKQFFLGILVAGLVLGYFLFEKQRVIRELEQAKSPKPSAAAAVTATDTGNANLAKSENLSQIDKENFDKRKVYWGDLSQKRIAILSTFVDCIEIPRQMENEICQKDKKVLIADIQGRILALKGDVKCLESSANILEFTDCARRNAIDATKKSFEMASESMK